METILFDRDGFLTFPENWNEELARRIAAENGVGELSEEHWEIIRFLRKHYLEGGLPAVSHVCHVHHFDHHCISDLFQSMKAAWHIAGLPNPGEEANAYM
ncbi:TusE/DsrC/DsvC family sulfur relay protein [Sulfuricella sp. T08]|uniref:TusE/DsrC/DsvC family sulfur relay protein n=1 Tax=Sulfuricella sp. T08 TaxID=1632857 RepID=UPI0006179C8D|nr:TusE/DsrC/DsvC family sulfur relay protein [Sulfuricella sp. T08]GAO37441.1 TusE/DsrC/DsvC family sulfur relay protein [Sulfuricella sp. T08]